MNRLDEHIVDTLVETVAYTIDPNGLAANMEIDDVFRMGRGEGVEEEGVMGGGEGAEDEEGVVDVSTLADTFLMHVRALDHTARVDSSFEEMYRFLDGRLDDDDLRLFARQYSETTRIARVRGDREEFFAMLHMYLRKSRRVEEAEEMHVQDGL